MANGLLSIGMNPSGDICCLHKSGSGTVTPGVLKSLIQLVQEKVAGVSKVFKGFIVREGETDDAMEIMRQENMLSN